LPELRRVGCEGGVDTIDVATVEGVGGAEVEGATAGNLGIEERREREEGGNTQE
jgi:hypothetical protein